MKKTSTVPSCPHDTSKIHLFSDYPYIYLDGIRKKKKDIIKGMNN
jgi:hypothetical protein